MKRKRVEETGIEIYQKRQPWILNCPYNILLYIFTFAKESISLYGVSKVFYHLLYRVWLEEFPSWDFHLVPRAPALIGRNLKMAVMTKEQSECFKSVCNVMDWRLSYELYEAEDRPDHGCLKMINVGISVIARLIFQIPFKLPDLTASRRREITEKIDFGKSGILITDKLSLRISNMYIGEDKGESFAEFFIYYEGPTAELSEESTRELYKFVDFCKYETSGLVTISRRNKIIVFEYPETPKFLELDCEWTIREDDDTVYPIDSRVISSDFLSLVKIFSEFECKKITIKVSECLALSGNTNFGFLECYL
jgi:hypothetical protein